MIQRLRLFSGLVLFAYVTSHLLNHALGLESLRLAELGRGWFLAIWRSLPGTVVLYGALVTHIVLALLAVYRRRHLRMPRWELIRLGLGLLIPLLLLRHVVGTRLLHELTGIDDAYARQMLAYWVFSPGTGLQQVTLLVLAWVHGCIGVHMLLRVKRWHTVTVPGFLAFAVLVPFLALGGFWDLGQEVTARSIDSEWVQVSYPQPTPAQAAVLDGWRLSLLGTFVLLVAATFTGRWVRSIWQRRHGVVRLTYPDGRQAVITPGTTVLEASRLIGMPHAALCGGRGRCSTCRVRIIADPADLPRPTLAETRVLRGVGAPPSVRLACQLRPTHDLAVFPLLPSATDLPAGAGRAGQLQGAEQEIVILFVDMRGYSRMAEQRLPYDVVFVLNQYFAAIGGAIEQSGGYLDKLLGDGVMALFGLRSGPEAGCREALRAAVEISQAIERLNRTLISELGEPLRIGIGIEAGHAVVGELGYGRARSLTAIGDAVNVASRLEALNKQYGSELVISARVAELAGLALTGGPGQQVEDVVRGRTTPLTLFVFGSATEVLKQSA